MTENLPKVDRIIRSRRRSIGLSITTDARLIIRAPHWTPLHEINSLIRQKHAWITRTRERFQKHRVLPKQFVEGEEFLFLGKAYALHIIEDLPRAVILGDDGLMLAQAVLRNAAEHIRNWYQEQALEYLAPRVKFYADSQNLIYNTIKVNNARTRWGSCSYIGNLNFTWRLIMAPARVVDYVVVHELMHLKQRNHARKFWQEVEAVIPDYRQDERWLKDNGHRLTI